MAVLTTAERNALPSSDFALPDTRDYPIQNIEHARDALSRSSGKPEEGKVRAAVERRYPQLKKTEHTVDIWKDDAKRLVYGVVLEPDLPDSQGDIVKAEEIEKAAHEYLVQSRKSDVQHNEVTKNFDGQPIAHVVESFIAPHDMTVAGEQVRKGAWVMGMKVNDDEVWSQIQKGELTGYSIGGSGVREPLAA